MFDTVPWLAFRTQKPTMNEKIFRSEDSVGLFRTIVCARKLRLWNNRISTVPSKTGAP